MTDLRKALKGDDERPENCVIPIILDDPRTFSAADYEAVIHSGEPVALAPAALARVAHVRERFLAHLATGIVCYGVNTGLGALAKTDLSPEEIARLPRQILYGRAVAIGPPLPAEAARGALLIKLVQFLHGAPAVSAGLCEVLAERINHGLAPFIPSQGHGMAGEIIPLSHMAQTLIGEGRVLDADGHPLAASQWLERRGLAPYDPQPKEGLSLIGGVAVAPALAWLRLREARRLAEGADLIAAASVEALAAPLEPYDAYVAALRPDPGLAESAAAMRKAMDGSRVTRRDRQAPVSFRATPQIHGALRAALDGLAEATMREMRAIGDNPAFVLGASAAEDRLLHCGNFHAAAHTGAIETASLALAQVGLLSERRLHRLLDARFSGLSPQLAARPGLDAGLVALHKASLGFACEIGARGAPPSLHHGDASFGQEDAMTMALPALDKFKTLMDLARRTLACELYAAVVALDARGEEAGARIEELRRRVRAIVPAYDGDRSYGIELEALLSAFDMMII